METKICNKCNVEKPSTSFYARNKKKGHLGLKYMCKECENNYGKKRYHTTYKHNENFSKAEYFRRIKRNYDLEMQDYFDMWDKTKGMCFICNTKLKSCVVEESEGVRAVVDHCHSTNKVRGILCHKCNGGLGQFDDRLDFLKRAVQYLEEHK